VAADDMRPSSAVIAEGKSGRAGAWHQRRAEAALRKAMARAVNVNLLRLLVHDCGVDVAGVGARYADHHRPSPQVSSSGS
jgi:hypothetical protein